MSLPAAAWSAEAVAVLAGVVDPAGRVLSRKRRLTPSTSARAVEDTIVSLVAEFSAAYPVAAVGAALLGGPGAVVR